MLRKFVGFLPTTMGSPARQESAPVAIQTTKPTPLQDLSTNRDASPTNENGLTAALKRASQEASPDKTPATARARTPVEVAVEVDEAGRIIDIGSDEEFPSADAVWNRQVLLRASRSPSKVPPTTQPAVVVHPPTSEERASGGAQQMAVPSRLTVEAEGSKGSKRKGKQKVQQPVELSAAEYDALVGADDDFVATQVSGGQLDPFPTEDADDPADRTPTTKNRGAPVKTTNRVPQVVIPPRPKSPSKTKAPPRQTDDDDFPQAPVFDEPSPNAQAVVGEEDTFPQAGDSDRPSEPPSKTQAKEKSKKKKSPAKTAKVASTSSKPKGKPKESTRAPVAQKRKAPKTKKKAKGARDDDEAETEVPTVSAFAGKRWKSYGACAQADDESGADPLRIGDCIYVIAPKEGEDEETDEDECDPHRYWIAEIVEIKADTGGGITPASKSNEGRAQASGAIVLKVKWFWRLRDFKSTSLKRREAIATELKALGFRTEVATGQKDQFRLQDMELIATDNVDCIALDSVAGRADVFCFNDKPEGGDAILAQKAHGNTKKWADSPESTGIDNFFYRIIWSLKDKGWIPTLPQHCTCKQHYDPAKKQIYCPDCEVWFHAKCLKDDGSYGSKDEAGGDAEKGKGKRGRDGAGVQSKGKGKKVRMEEERDVPDELRELAESSITRGGDGGMLAGNLDLVQRAKILVGEIERGERDPPGWEDHLDLDDWKQAAAHVEEYTRAVGSKKKKGEQLDDGDAFICPECKAFI